jgi:glutaredoxin
VKVSRLELLGLFVVLVGISTASSWWVRSQQQEAGEQVAQLAKAGDIQMFSSVTCGICAEARLWFTQNQIAFNECLIEKDAACRSNFERSGAVGTPLIVVRGQPQLGFNRALVLRALQGTS